MAQALVVRGHADFATLAAYEAFVRDTVDRGSRAVADARRGGSRRAPPAAVDRDSQLHDLSAGRPPVEHDSRRAPDLFGAGAPDGPHGRGPRACRCHRGPLSRTAGADHAAAPRRGRAPRRLPPCHWLVGAEARRLCALSLSRGPVSLGDVPTRLRCPADDARRARRRGVPADPAARRAPRRGTGHRRAPRRCSTRGRFDYAAVQQRVAPPTPTIPTLHLPPPDLRVYDTLLVGVPA